MKIPPKFILIFFITLATLGPASTVTPSPKTTYGSWDSLTANTVPKGTRISVGGWGADTAANPTPTSGVVAKIFVDGKLLIQVPVVSDRPDVTAYYGFTDCGFNASIDTSTLSVGKHTVEVQVGGGPSGWNQYHAPTSIGSGSTITITESK